MSIGDQLASDIQAHAGSESSSQCSKAVRQSIERVTNTFSEFCIHIFFLIYKSTGKSLRRTQHAKNYGPSLQAAGFKTISNRTPLRAGDVRIIQPAHGHRSGHIQVHTGNRWGSDFKQQDQWPGSIY